MKELIAKWMLRKASKLLGLGLITLKNGSFFLPSREAVFKIAPDEIVEIGRGTGPFITGGWNELRKSTESHG